MKRIIPLAGVEMPASVALPTITRTPEGLAMGGIPGWTVLADPAYSTGSAVRNRARPNAMMPTTGSGSMTVGAMAGRPALIGTNSLPRLTVPTPMNPDAWTAFFAIQTTHEGSTGGRELLRASNIDNTGISPRVTIRTNGTIAIIESQSANIRLQGPAVPDNVPCLLMATSSVRDGLRLFLNGEITASNPDDKRPLDVGFGAGEYSLFRGNSSVATLLIGMHGILDLDLGWPEHAGYRRAIEGFVMGYYGIG